MFLTRTVPSTYQLTNSHIIRLRAIQKRLKDLFTEVQESSYLLSELQKLPATKNQPEHAYKHGFISWYREYEAIIGEYEVAKGELIHFVESKNLTCKKDIQEVIDSQKEELTMSQFYPDAERNYQAALKLAREKSAKKVANLQNEKMHLEQAYDRRHPSYAANPIGTEFYLGAFGTQRIPLSGAGPIIKTAYFLYHLVDKLITTLNSWRLQYEIDKDLPKRTTKVKQEIKAKNHQNPQLQLTQQFFKCEKYKALLAPETQNCLVKNTRKFKR